MTGIWQRRAGSARVEAGPDRRRRRAQPTVAALEGRQLLSLAPPVGPAAAPAEIRAESATASASKTAGEWALSVARQWEGHTEESGNRNHFTQYFYDRGTRGTNGEAWCADFVSYCFEVADEHQYHLGELRRGYSYVGDVVQWFRDRHDWHTTAHDPNPGDVIAFDWHNGGDSYDHIGIVTRATSDKVYYISGNTSNPGGGPDGVFEKSISRDSSSILGYGYR